MFTKLTRARNLITLLDLPGNYKRNKKALIQLEDIAPRAYILWRKTDRTMLWSTISWMLIPSFLVVFLPYLINLLIHAY